MRTEQRCASALSLIAGAATVLTTVPSLEDVSAALWLLALGCLGGAAALTGTFHTVQARHSAR